MSGLILSSKEEDNEDPLTYLEVRRYLCDFRTAPGDPNYGNLVDSVVVYF